jgi:activator of HSP90 ATPase
VRSLKKYYIVKAPPEDVYKALTNPLTLQLWTGEPVVMEAVPGTEFSLWDGSITGRNVSFIENSTIVQEWYFGDEPVSTVVLKLHPHKAGTSVELRHDGIPDSAYEEIADGWDTVYFASLQEFYG